MRRGSLLYHGARSQRYLPSTEQSVSRIQANRLIPIGRRMRYGKTICYLQGELEQQRIELPVSHTWYSGDGRLLNPFEIMTAKLFTNLSQLL